MNYRHHFHAGNFADVMKHTILLSLVRGLQNKDRGFLYLDTHAGRGVYDLALASRGLTLPRAPEWPGGVGRLLDTPRETRPAMIDVYLAAVARAQGALPPPDGLAPENLRPTASASAPLQVYPGSPWFVWDTLRPQDRMVLCERHPEEAAALGEFFAGARRVRVEERDGYDAVRAHLPPLERRALVLIDPPYEQREELVRAVAAVQETLRRLPAATIALWYPIAERSGADTLDQALRGIRLPPTWLARLEVEAEDAPPRMKGCGLMVLNPPWRLYEEVQPVMQWLGATLGNFPAARGTISWIVPE